MVDLHKTDGLLQTVGLRVMTNEEKDIYYAMVLEQHGITQAQFDSSLVWYTAHPKLFDKIYPKVQKQLAEEKAAFEAAHYEELHARKSSKGQIALSDEEEEMPTPQAEPIVFTQAQWDSIHWVQKNGLPTPWKPYDPNQPVIPFSAESYK